MTRVGDAEIPLDYGDPVLEHRAVREAVGLSDRSHRRVWRTAGPDAARFLHGLLSNDIEGLAPGQGCYATFLTERGMILTDLVVLRRRDDFLLHAPPETGTKGLALLARFLVGDDATMEDLSGRIGILGVLGPRSAEAIAAIGAPLGSIPPWHFVERDFEGGTLLVSAARWTGEEGFDILAPVALLAALWDRLLGAVRARGGRPLGEAALETLRIEAGTPRAGRDFDEETIPQQAGLDHALSFTKGCFRGQEIVLRVRTRGHANRSLVGLTLQGPAAPPRGTKLLHEGVEVGSVTSATLSPTLGKPIALAMVHRTATAPGTVLEVAAAPARSATVVPLPFYHRA
jgi:folate-binding protein YgfZ